MVSTSNSTVGVLASHGNVNLAINGDFNVNSSSLETFPELVVPRTSQSFQGRNDDLERIHELFFKERKRKVVISGLAGYGKTELAKHFARHAKEGGHVHRVFWVHAETSHNLKTTHNVLKKTYQTHTNVTVLYVFDNAGSRRDISEYLPPDTSNALVLVTSQVNDWGDDAVTVSLKPVSEHAAFKIFEEILGLRFNRVTENEVKEIIEFMDGIPLGLVVVAGHLRREMDVFGSDFDVLKFKQEIFSPSMLDKGIDRAVDSAYRHSIRTAIHFTLNKMSTWLDPQENNITHQVLCICAHLEPDRINIQHVEEILNVCGVCANELIRRCVHAVTDFSFIQSENDHYFVIHRICQELLRKYYDDEKKSMKEACYKACLRWELERYRSVHRTAILTQADNNKAVVNNILREYCPSIDKFDLQWSHPNYLKFKTLLQCLVTYVCYECLLSFLNSINISSRQHIVKELELVHIAAAASHGMAADMVRLLLEKGGDVQAKDRTGETALHRAARWGREAAVCALLEMGGEVQAMDEDGRTALHVAAWRGQEAVVRVLLDAGSDVRARDRDDRTSLHEAAWWGHEAVTRVLLDRGADVNAQDCDGRTALDVAFAQGRTRVHHILSVHGDITKNQ